MSGSAQAVVMIDDQLECPACVIETGLPVTLAIPSDRFSFTSIPKLNVARDSEGHYIASPVTGDAVIAVFGPDGTYRSSYGKIGRGPGEFPDPFPLLTEVGEDDVLYAIARTQLHTLGPQAATIVGQVQMPVRAYDAVVLRDGLAVQAPVRTEIGNTTIQLLRPDGTIVTSIGPARPGDESSRWGLYRILGRANDGVDIWSGHAANRYQIIRYGPTGEEKVRLERSSKWFPPYSDGKPGAPYLEPSGPRIDGIHQDEAGLLWVAIVRAPSSFSPIAGEGEEVQLSPYLDMNRLLYTTIEVLDPAAGRLVARREFDAYVRFVSTSTGDGLFVYSLHPDALGELVCIVTPLELRKP